MGQGVKTASAFGTYCINVDFHVLPIITNESPSQLLDISTLNIPNHVKNKLAYPSFNVRCPIDILLGTELCFDLFDGEKVPVFKDVVFNHSVLVAI